MGAVMISDRLVAQLGGAGEDAAVFSNGFTYSGHPVAAAAASKNIEIMEREGLMAHVQEVGPYFQERMQSLRQSPIVGDVRGLGLMACVECDVGAEVENAEQVSGEAGSRHRQALPGAGPHRASLGQPLRHVAATHHHQGTDRRACGNSAGRHPPH